MSKRKYYSKRRKKTRYTSNKTKIIRSLFLFSLLIIILIYISFKSWKSKQESLSLFNSQIIQTALGPIEYKIMGNGPVILLSHMGGTGSDNIKLFREIADAGYQIICPSRPGYLQTPLSENADIEFQANLYAELLNYLKISEKIFIMGISAGGPSAIEFAAKYPSRCKGLILHSAITKQFSPLTELKQYSKIINVMASPTWQDIFSWVNYKGGQFFSRKFMQEILERATTYNHELTKEMATDLLKDKKNKDYLFLFNNLTSPLSTRMDGLQNDLKYAEYFVPKTIKIPVLITHSHVDRVVNFTYAHSLKEQLKKVELYEYDGNGHAFWFGKEWKVIQRKTLAFLKKHELKNEDKIDEKLLRLSSETWVSKINGALLKIDLSSNFSLDFPGVDETTLITGNITVRNDTLIFSTDNESNYCKNMNGVYRFVFKQNELILKLVADKCEYRSKHFIQGWFKL